MERGKWLPIDGSYDVAAKHLDMPFLNDVGSGDQRQQARLAHPVRSNEPDHASGRHVESDTVERSRRAVGKSHAIEADDRTFIAGRSVSRPVSAPTISECSECPAGASPVRSAGGDSLPARVRVLFVAVSLPAAGGFPARVLRACFFAVLPELPIEVALAVFSSGVVVGVAFAAVLLLVVEPAAFLPPVCVEVEGFFFAPPVFPEARVLSFFFAVDAELAREPGTAASSPPAGSGALFAAGSSVTVLPDSTEVDDVLRGRVANSHPRG